MAQVQGEHIMHCWHYGGCTKGDHGCWSEYCCNMSLSLSWSFMVFGGLWFFFADLVYSQGEHVLRGSITLFPWCQRGRVIWCCCHQVQRGRLLALWCMCCTWWQPTHRRSTHLYISRWIYRRDIRCDIIHGMRDSSKESKGKSSVWQVSFAIKSKGGDCWHYEISVVLDGKPYWWQIIVQKVTAARNS